MADESSSEPELSWDERARRAGVRIVDPAVITRENIEALKIIDEQIQWANHGRDLERERCAKIAESEDAQWARDTAGWIAAKIRSGE